MNPLVDTSAIEDLLMQINIWKHTYEFLTNNWNWQTETASIASWAISLFCVLAIIGIGKAAISIIINWIKDH